MSKRLSRAFLTSALLIGAVSAVSMVWSKPPDLPTDIRVICERAIPAQQPCAPVTLSGCPAMPNYPHPHIEDPAQVEPPEKACCFKSFAEWLDGQISDNFDFAMPDLLGSLSSIWDSITDQSSTWLLKPSLAAPKLEIGDDGSLYMVTEHVRQMPVFETRSKLVPDHQIKTTEFKSGTVTSCPPGQVAMTDPRSGLLVFVPAVPKAEPGDGRWVDAQIGDNFDFAMPDVLQSVSAVWDAVAAQIGDWWPVHMTTNYYGEDGPMPWGRCGNADFQNPVVPEVLPPPMVSQVTQTHPSNRSFADRLSEQYPHIGDNVDPNLLTSLGRVFDGLTDLGQYLFPSHIASNCNIVGYGAPSELATEGVDAPTIHSISLPAGMLQSGPIPASVLMPIGMQPQCCLVATEATAVSHNQSDDNKTTKTVIRGPIQLVFGPAGKSELPLDANNVPPGGMRIECNQLTVVEHTAANGKVSKTMHAENQVRCWVDDIMAVADVVTIDHNQNVVVFKGIPSSPAVVQQRVGGPGSIPRVTRARTIVYNRTTNTIQQDGVNSIKGGQESVSPTISSSETAQCCPLASTTTAQCNNHLTCIPVRFASAPVVAEFLNAYFTCCPPAVADDANCVWVNAPPICMAEAQQLVQQVDDKFAATPIQVQSITLKHADAYEVAADLNQYFTDSWDWPITCGDGTCRQEVIVLPEVRTNTLIIVAPCCGLEKTVEILEQMELGLLNIYHDDKNARLDVLLNQSEDLRKINGEWRRFWMQDQPRHITTDVLDNNSVPRQGPQEPEPQCRCSPSASAAIGAAAGAIACQRGCECEHGFQVVPLDAEEFKIQSARHFLEIGRHCEENGDYEMAMNCYEEAARVCPGSKYAGLANAKLAMVTVTAAASRSTRGSYEESEAAPEMSMASRRVHEAYRMLQMGERFEQAGDLDNAYRCYQDARALCPACQDGQKALERMIQIEGIRARQGDPRLSGIEEQEPPVDRRRPPYSDEEVEQREQARTLYDLGENARNGGQTANAYNYYQETHIAFPDSYYGQRAIERMSQLESQPSPNRINNHQTLGGQPLSPPGQRR